MLTRAIAIARPIATARQPLAVPPLIAAAARMTAMIVPTIPTMIPVRSPRVSLGP